MGKIYMTACMKGGCAKTVTTYNLAYSLKELGKKVLCVDFDSQANLSICFGVENPVAVPVTIGHLMMAQIDDDELPGFKEYIQSRNGVDFISSSMMLSAVDAKLRLEMGAEKMLSEILEPLRDRYDVIIIDAIVDIEPKYVILENGTRLDEEVCKKLFRLTAEEQYMDDLDVSLLEQVQDDQRINIQTVINHSQERNNELISEKINQINAWADDKIEATQLKVEEMRTQRKELQRQSDSAVNMIEKERIESEIMAISKKIRMIWMKLADDEEEIEDMRRKMISDIRKEVLKETEVTLIFAISFEVK